MFLTTPTEKNWKYAFNNKFYEVTNNYYFSKFVFLITSKFKNSIKFSHL